MNQDLVIVKYGEIALKGSNRPQFEALLLRNLRWAVRSLPDTHVHPERGRFRIETRDPQAALRCAVRVFGVVGASLARAVPRDLDSIQDAAVELLSGHQGSFKVQARRADKSFPLTTPDLNKLLGAHVLNLCPGLTVDVHEPDFTLHVEIRDSGAYLYKDTISGPGGLPTGVSNQGLLLLSGGIDSPVAGWLAMRRGIKLQGVHFHAFPFTSERAQQKVCELAEILAAYVGEIPVHMVHFTEAQTELRRRVPGPLLITIMRRLMIRVAARIARENDVPALITGESVGQVASQTLESIAAINEVTSMPILRPLVTADKTEIVALARRIGTYETSILPYEDCCTLFVPKHPETRPSMQAVTRAEASLDIGGLVEGCLAKTERIMAQPHPAAALYQGGPLFG